MSRKCKSLKVDADTFDSIKEVFSAYRKQGVKVSRATFIKVVWFDWLSHHFDAIQEEIKKEIKDA